MDKGRVESLSVPVVSSPAPLSFTLPYPPSMNSLYGINYRTRSVYLTNDARYWKSKAKLLIPHYPIPSFGRIFIELQARNHWYCKNGNIRKADVHNLVKVVVDAISEKCGFDDSQVWSFSCNKVESNEQTVAVTMGVLNEARSEEGVKGEAGTSTKD